MGILVSVRSGDDDTLWAVVATVGRRSRVAEVFRSRAQALDDTLARLATEHEAVTAGCRAGISSPCPSRTLRGLRRA